MKKIVTLCVVASFAFAKMETDVALTAGYNKLDQPYYVYSHRAFYGVRAGVYIDDHIGFQIGFEKPDQANCIGLQLKRYYANTLLMTKLANGLKPYGVGTLGYETSSADDDYRPSQAFLGLGLGVKYDINQNFNLFLETRALKSLKSDDLTLATTLGLGYSFDTGYATSSMLNDEVKVVHKKQNITRPKIRPVRIEKPMPTLPVASELNVSYDIRKPIISKTIVVKPASSQGNLFVQIVALTTSSPRSAVRKLHAEGISNVHVKKMYQKGTSYSFVVVGPYETRASASRALRKLKAHHAGAFIKNF